MPRKIENATFSSEFMFEEKVSPDLKRFRDVLFSRFSRQIGLLLESKRPRKQNSTKGRLNTRIAYRHPFSDNIFSKYEHIPSSDTTIVMLIDGSGSMSSRDSSRFSRIDTCNAVCSAFAKSVKNVLKDELKVEIFVKSAPAIESESLGVAGQFPTLTRIFTNTTPKTNSDFDKLLGLNTYSPITVDGDGVGSYTAEYSVLPALMNWAENNITTKNMIVFNLTDGGTYINLGTNHFRFGNSDTGLMKSKYLRGVPNLSLCLGNDVTRKELTNMYGKDVIFSDGEGDFVPAMFKTLTRFVDESVQ